MKKKAVVALGLSLLLGVTACGKKAPETPETPADSGKTEQTTKTETEEPEKQEEEEKAPFQEYEYAYGSMTIGVPWSLPATPTDEGDSVVFSDPEGEWTVRFKPLGINDTGYKSQNLTSLMDSFKTMGNYQNIEASAVTLSGYSTDYFSFEMNPDWDDATQGYTLSYHEPHAFYVVNYGDAVVGEWGGLLIDIAAPEKTRGSLSAITDDDDVKTLVNNIVFHESDGLVATSIPGITVSFPGRWTPGSDGDHTIWAGIRGTTTGSVYFGSSVYADPKEAASYIDGSQTLEFNGRTWYGGVRTTELTESVIKGLELFTDFTEYHALYVRLNLTDWESDQDFWDYVNSDLFASVMDSVVTEPDSFHNPEDDKKDKNGFECNNINEISAYTGDAKDLTIPATIGTNDIVGVNCNVFKNNTDITSVTLEEGIVYIESSAFSGCTNLKTVVLPNSLTLVDSRAFEGCTSLESVEFGDNLIEVGYSAFEDCTSLKDVILPDTVQLIGSNAFAKVGTGDGRFECKAEGTVYKNMALADTKFDSVVIGAGADLSDFNIMQNFEGRSISIGDGVTTLGDYFLVAGFDGETKLCEFDLPSSITNIGCNAFLGRKGLTEFDFTCIESLGESAFSTTGLKNIVIPGTMKVIPDSAFYCCGDVESITINEGVEVIESYAFCSAGSADKKMTGTYNFLSDEDVAAHKDVVHVDEPEYKKFLNITLPSTIKSVQESAFLGVRLEGLYLPWLTDMGQLPEEFMPGFDSYECIYVPQETYDSLGNKLDKYFSQDESFTYWGGKVRVYDGRHHYWTDEELGLDA